MSTAESSKSPVPPAPGGSKLDNLSKEDLVKFTKKQVAHVAEMKKTQSALMEKLKSKASELETVKQECEALKAVNEKMTISAAEKVNNNPTECTECLTKSAKMIDLEKELADIRDKASKADMFSLELRDLESKVDHLTRGLKEKTEALIKAQEVISENDQNINDLRKNTSSSKSSIEQLTEENSRLTKSLQDEKRRNAEVNAQLRSAECRIAELSDQQGSEKLGLAKKMAESENRAGILEEAIEVLKNENEKLTLTNEEINTKLENAEKEYNEFKQKAHFVLEKKGKQDEENRETMEKLANANEMITSMEGQMEELKKDNNRLAKELSTARDNIDKLTKQCNSSKSINTDIEKLHASAMDDLRMNSARTIQRLEEELRVTRKTRDESDEKVKEITTSKEKVDYLLQNERKRSEMENGSLKIKLEMATKHLKSMEREIEELKAENESRGITANQQQLQKAVAAVIPQQIHHQMDHPAVIYRPPPSMSDSVSCYDEPQQRERSLEDVLYGDLGEEYRSDSIEFTEERFAAIMEELENMKKTNTHVSELLSEAETTNGRLVSQNTLLKEEIRRMERKEGREEELSNEKNMEYLKNVIIQFLKIESVQAERNQLIVVLQRVLHLAPKEVDILKATAEQMSAAQSAANSSWSSYFSGWSSPTPTTPSTT